MIVSLDGNRIVSGTALNEYITANPLSDRPVRLVYVRNGLEYEAEVTPAVNESYSLGFSYNTYAEKTGGLNIIKYSAAEVKYWIVTTVKGLGQLFRGRVSADDLGGPVRIVNEISNVMTEAKPYGALITIVELINWCVLLSANLGVMNLLPIPAVPYYRGNSAQAAQPRKGRACQRDFLYSADDSYGIYLL